MSNPTNTLPDQFLVAAIKMDSHEAFSVIFRNYYKGLVMYAAQFLGSLSAGEDVVQGVFTQMWDERKNLNIQVSLRSWLLRTVQNKCLDEIRHQKVKLQYETAIHSELLSLTPEDYCFYNEANDRLEEAINALSPNEREAFLLHRRDRLKYAEIAERLGVPQRTVEDRISRALKSVRKALSDLLILLLTLITAY